MLQLSFEATYKVVSSNIMVADMESGILYLAKQNREVIRLLLLKKKKDSIPNRYCSNKIPANY